MSLIFAGCASSRRDEGPNAGFTRLIRSDPGRVMQANVNFVVMTFPFGNVPEPGKSLNVYRSGKKVAELKVTGPQRDLHTVADVVSGNAQTGDEVRSD